MTRTFILRRMRIIILIISFFVAVFAHAQETALNQSNNVVNVSFASSNIRFAREQGPTFNQQVKQQNEWTPEAWRGEKVSIQIVVWSSGDISSLSLQVHDLICENGQKIDAGNINIGFLRYVTTDEFGPGCGYRKTTDFDSLLVADPIDPVSSVSVKKNTLQPVWLSIKVPAATKQGHYKGIISVNAGKKVDLNISLNVLDQVLPSADKWKFDLDFWQHPAAIARVHNVPLWSEEHFKYMRPYYTMLADAGQKCITTSIINEPWGHQTYDDFPGLIRWIKKKDGSWLYNYSLFDQYVSFVMSCGIKDRINCYTMIPWKLSFQYYDERSGKDTVINASPGTREYDEYWSSMLTDFSKHLKAEGWFSITSISMDERSMQDMQAVIKLVHGVDPQWKISLAGEYHPEIEKDIYDYCVASKWELADSVLTRRKSKGYHTTVYTCCVEQYPNGFTFSPPAENVWIGWFAAAKGFTGYLRWAYNSWPKDPVQDSRFTAWPAGDTFLVYPGPMSSIRFEKMIEGIQDFEKIGIVRDQFIKMGSEKDLKQLERILSSFEIKNLETIPAEKMIEDARSILNRHNDK